MTVVIFGGSGQLATKRLIPALASSKQLCEVEVLAVGRTALSDEEYFSRLTPPHDAPEGAWELLQKHIHYVQADHASEGGYKPLSEHVKDGDRLLYLAVPPTATSAVIEAIVVAGLHEAHEGVTRIILEKPFGVDAESAAALKELLLKHFPADCIYPIDHYLAKETVSNLLAFRFGNALFEPLWNAKNIREIQITVAEESGVEERLSSYVGLGATKDLLQNHILQLLALLIMDEPADWSPEAVAEVKLELLKQVHPEPGQTVLGQYRAEASIEEQLGSTETYAASILSLDCDRWRGVPIAVRTGKKLAVGVTDITVHFRPCASALFGTKGHANRLTFRIQPDESIFLSLAVKEPGKEMGLATARMTFCYRDSFRGTIPDAYVRVLEAVFHGDMQVAVTLPVIEESWRILDEMNINELSVYRYDPKSWGPTAADDLMTERGSHWIVTEGDVCNGVTLTE